LAWGKVNHGTVEGHEVTFKTNDSTGETLIADGVETKDEKRLADDKDDKLKNDGELRASHDHYGSGGGKNDNGTDRGAYTGPGSK